MKTDKTELESVNKQLKEQFGTDETGRPVYRVVFSDDQVEKRFGTFREMYGHILIREYKGMDQVKKYNYFKEPRYVLEKLMYAMSDEVIGLDLDNRCYEPIYVFEDKYGNELEVHWWACEAVVKALLGERKPRRNQAMDDSDENAERDREVAYFEDVLADEQGGDAAVKLGSREAVTVPGDIS